MGFSKLKIPKICEFCEKPFEAKTITTRFCCKACADKSGKKQKLLQKAIEQKQSILENSKNKIVEIQTRPYISITEATILFGISKDTLRRLIKNGIIPAHNFGQRLTRISKEHLEKMFTTIKMPIEKEKKLEKLDYTVEECYTLSEVSSKFGANPSTVSSIIRKFSIPKRQVGNFVYVPKEQIDKVFAGK
ncbi:DNA-binding protein [Elizabethkingia anophelis]|nr:DNA-binding protein [Elizabethkingia anophelis]